VGRVDEDEGKEEEEEERVGSEEFSLAKRESNASRSFEVGPAIIADSDCCGAKMSACEEEGDEFDTIREGFDERGDDVRVKGEGEGKEEEGNERRGEGVSSTR